jgi:murein DD-endopeptidase MepM/ murein hydrolase activator NlpD
MTTARLIPIAAALVAAALAPVSVQSAPDVAARTFALRQTQTLGNEPTVPPAYGWPVKPFNRQHPVRAFLDDPRIGHEGGTAFHFGIDVAAPDGTPVYAVEGGILYLSRGSLSVASGPHHEFGYWHVRAAAGLRQHQIVHKHQRLGTIATGWGHVHFAERLHDEYVNPLRPGALGPYTDPVPPTVADIRVAPHGTSFQLVAHAYDTTWPPVPGPWTNEPVTPALLRWRIGSDGAWHVTADFRERMLDRNLFASVYAPETRQNHQGRPGAYAFFLSHAWKPADGSYDIEVEAADTRGNRAVGSIRITVVDGEVR